MRPDTAARQLEYVVSSRLVDDSWGHWEATVYTEAFEHVAENGTHNDMHALIARISDEVYDGHRPSPGDVRQYADTLVTASGRPLADGGDPDK